jgi:hypothetical protein
MHALRLTEEEEAERREKMTQKRDSESATVRKRVFGPVRLQASDSGLVEAMALAEQGG